MIRVLIADDQALVRDGFRAILDRAPDIEVVAEAETGSDAVDRAALTRPQVVLMDLAMPVMDGLAATEALLARPAPPRVLVLTTYETDENLHRALRAGASGFLLKDVRARDLIEAVRTVAAGDALLAPALTRRVIAGWVAAHPAGPRPVTAIATLSPREREVVQHVARGLSNLEIARALVLSEATVKSHVTRILGKLGLRDRVQVVVMAYESGLTVPGAT